MATEAQKTIAARIAQRASRKELETLRMLGYGWADAYDASFKVLDEIYALAFRRVPEPPLTRTRMITGRG